MGLWSTFSAIYINLAKISAINIKRVIFSCQLVLISYLYKTSLDISFIKLVFMSVIRNMKKYQPSVDPNHHSHVMLEKYEKSTFIWRPDKGYSPDKESGYPNLAGSQQNNITKYQYQCVMTSHRRTLFRRHEPAWFCCLVFDFTW